MRPGLDDSLFVLPLRERLVLEAVRGLESGFNQQTPLNWCVECRLCGQQWLLHLNC